MRIIRSIIVPSAAFLWLFSIGGCTCNGSVANHITAIGAHQAQGSAQRIYRRLTGAYANDSALLYNNNGKMLKLLDKSIVEADGPEATPYRGYYFVDLSKGLDFKSEYAYVSHPAEYCETGRLSFYSDQTGTVWQKDLGSGQIVEPIDDLAGNGWVEVGE